MMKTARISLAQRLAMYLRQTPVGKIKRALQRGIGYGLHLDASELEAHYLAGGDPLDLVEALVLARENGIQFSETQARARQLVASQQGRSLRAEVEAFARRGGTDLDAEPLPSSGMGDQS